MQANNLIAVMSLFFIFAIFVFVIGYALESKVAMMIVGGLLVWGKDIISFYFRKRPKE